MFGNDKQVNRCCTVLLRRVFLESFWSEGGPTDKEEIGLSHGQHTMLRVAFDLYNGSTNVTLREIMQTLDERNRRCIAELLLAESRGPVEIDRWIQTWERRRLT